MKRKTILLIILSVMIFLIGFGLFSVASMPIQDSGLAPASVIAKQHREILIGKITMIIGALCFVGSIIKKIVANKN